jgi:PKD repeat protein
MIGRGPGVYYAKFGSGSAPFNIYSCYNLGAEQGHEFAGLGYQTFGTTNSIDYHIFSFRANRTSGNGQLRRNLTTLVSSTITGVIPSTYNLTNGNSILLGRYAMTGSPYFLNGDIAEVIFYNRALTDTERNQVESYLNDKYAPGLNLGKDTALVNLCPYTIIAPPGYSNILWSTGQTSSSISVTTPGQYWLRGTNIFGVISYDTIFVNLPLVPEPINTGICANGTNTWNAEMGPGFTYSWSTGANTPSLTISSPGTYWVQVTDPLGCTRLSDNYSFSVDTYPQTAYLGNDTSLCSGNLIALQIGAGQTISYTWPDGSSASNYAVDTTGSYFLESVNVNGCVAQDTIHINVVGIAPTADFVVTDVCDLTAAVFDDNSFTPDLSPVDEWLWTFGDGQESTEQNPQHVFANGPGTYNVQLYVAQGGCGAFYSAPVEVFERPQASFSASGFCSNDPTFFVDASQDGSSGISGWLWNFGQPSSGLNNSSVLPNPMKQYGATGIYTVTLQVTDGNNCMDEEVQTIAINTSPVAEFTASNICAGATIDFTNTSSVPNPDFIQNYLWDFGDNTFSILPVPNKTYTDPGYHTITLTVTSSNGCFTESQEQMFTHAIPVPSMSVGPVCMGTYTAIEDASSVLTGIITSSSWSIDLGAPITGSEISYIFPTPGSHNIELTATSDFGCTKDTMVIVEVNPLLNAEFEVFPAVVIVGEPVEFINSSVGATNYLWSFGEGGVSTDSSPIYFYSSTWIDSTMTAELYVENSFGCKDTSRVDFLVKKARFDLEVNNVFVSEENGFYNVGVSLKNLGTAMIEYTDVELRLSNGVSMQERFEDTIFSGQTKIKVFTSKPSAFVSTEDGEDTWICAEGISYSALMLSDEDRSNNEYCKNVEGTLPVLIGPNPNPATDQFTFSVLVTEEKKLTVDLIDSRGRVVRRFMDDTSVPVGLHDYEVSLIGVNSGVYWLRMIDTDQSVIRKIVVE